MSISNSRLSEHATQCERIPSRLSNTAMMQAIRHPHLERRNISAQILMVQENERQRIAKDLHDVLGQSLTLISLGLEECAYKLREQACDSVQESLDNQRTRIKNALNDLRRIAMDLRPPMLDDLGLLATMSWFFRDFQSTCPTIQIKQNIEVSEQQIPVMLKVSVFRILQEAFSNILKHANADIVQINLTRENEALSLLVVDNGQGFNMIDQAADSEPSNGFGLMSMYERAMLSGGNCLINSSKGQGTRILVTWPCS